MQTDYVFTFTLYTVTNTEELIQMLFFGDLGLIFNFIVFYLSLVLIERPHALIFAFQDLNVMHFRAAFPNLYSLPVLQCH